MHQTLGFNCHFPIPVKIQLLLAADCKQLHYCREITWNLRKPGSVLFTTGCLGTLMRMLCCSLPELLRAQHCPDISMKEP